MLRPWMKLRGIALPDSPSYAGRGAHQGESLRTLVLRDLREIGIQVSDEEIRGGHKRERGSQ